MKINENIQKIISNQAHEVDTILHSYLLLGFSGMILSMFLTGLITLVPVHNLILEPNYWYETMWQYFIVTYAAVAVMILNCSYYMNVDCIKTWTNYLLQLIAMDICGVCGICVCYYVWTILLDQRYPMPFQGNLIVYINFVLYLLIQWHTFPPSMRQHRRFRKRLQYCFLAIASNLVVWAGYQMLLKHCLDD